jgi:ribose transport system permease protein
MRDTLLRIAFHRGALLIFFILAISLGTSIATPLFYSSANLTALFLALSVNATVAVGMVILLISGGFDLSVSSNAALAGVIASIAFSHGANTFWAILASLLVGAFVGMLNGLLIAKLGLNALVTTLASLGILRGLVYILTGGTDRTNFPDSFVVLGQGSLFGMPLPIWFALLITLIAMILMKNLRFLRRAYFIGGNLKAARTLGFNVDRTIISYYVIAGSLAALGGLIMTARVGSATTTASTGLELAVIAAVVVGGASLNGGEGSVFGAFLGVLLLTLINNILGILGVSTYWQTFVSGAVLLGAVVLDRLAILLRERTLANEATRLRRTVREAN